MLTLRVHVSVASLNIPRRLILQDQDSTRHASFDVDPGVITILDLLRDGQYDASTSVYFCWTETIRRLGGVVERVHIANIADNATKRISIFIRSGSHVHELECTAADGIFMKIINDCPLTCSEDDFEKLGIFHCVTTDANSRTVQERLSVFERLNPIIPKA